ncbi:unnamed protein product [Acanthoscelides obtectus]|uniref:28S ribosomal protein S27, mitochondrial n=1 Tax=Acanthoscelides obtectus TaxID=200917 RepID=A0A9P0NZG5_ACAOB|nr:unnamed protein product [Acanthoscelides obtectus]CAK1679438.1 28S ribosomal protein S27, mitochondrial [Acanthoscelides obtectus]
MFRFFSTVPRKVHLCKWHRNSTLNNLRTFLSQAYYCDEVWDRRLNSPLLQKVNLDELYYELDQRYQKTRQISAVDVDIFTNAVKTSSYMDEMLDLTHKLRLSADSCNTLDSTPHAVVRNLMKYDPTELPNIVDDRLNFGIFLDYHTANLLLDKYWKDKNYAAGARVAQQFMLQEEMEHPATKALSLLHCYNYLLKPEGWSVPEPPTEPEEEVKIRVKYLRNPYDDDHFDLREPNKIVGKSLAMFTKQSKDPLNKSLNLLGWALYEKPDKLKRSLEECKSNNIEVYKEIVDQIPESLRDELQGVKTESANVQQILEDNVKTAVQKTSESDIAEQCKTFEKWETERQAALQEQKQRLSVAQRLSNIEGLKKELEEKETKLWFFENEEKIELGIEAKKVYYPKRWFGNKKKPRKVDEGYVPPEI